MDKKKIERINELARKKKATGLTEAETAEQAELRREYLAEYRENMKAMLDSLVIQEQDGTRPETDGQSAGPMIRPGQGKVNLSKGFGSVIIGCCFHACGAR